MGKGKVRTGFLPVAENEKRKYIDRRLLCKRRHGVEKGEMMFHVRQAF
jgi:hypothetical protein